MGSRSRPERPQVHVVLAEFPRVVAAIIRGAVEEAGMRVDEFASSADALRHVARQSTSTVLVLPSGSTGVRDAWARVLRINPAVRVLSVSTSARRADVVELRLLGRDVGRRAIVDAVRAAIARPAS